MIEIIVCNYLKNKLGIPAYPEKPDRPPDEYILIEKTGGSKKDHISKSTIAIKSHAKTKYLAAKLNEDVKEKMDALCELADICGVRLNSDYDFTDSETKHYRYQAIFEITHY